MMQIDTAVDSLRDTGIDPYEVPADVQANPEDYGSPYDDMIGLLRTTTVLLDRLANTADAAREQPRPTMIPLSSVPFSTTIALRTTEIVLTASVAAAITLVVGTSNNVTYQFAAADSKRFPYIVSIGRGVDLSLATTAGTATGYLIAYPE